MKTLPRLSLKFLFLLVTTLAVALFVFIVCYRELHGISGVHETPQIANLAFDSRLELPTDARNVNYFACICWVEADFEITEDNFKAWCERNRWTVVDIDSANPGQFIPARTSPEATAGRVNVERGYRFTTRHGGGVFDSTKNRVSISHYDC